MSADLAQVLAESPYPAGVPLRFSALKSMARSPAHCLEALRDGKEPTLAMRLGTGAHSLILGGPEVVVYDGIRRGKAWDAYELEHEGKIIVSPSEWEKAKGMADAVKSHPLAQRVLFTPDAPMVYEETIRWQWRGRDMRSTPDARSDRHIVDLKTCRDAEPDALMWQARKLSYHAQLALYGLAMEAAIGRRPRDYYLVAVESAPPHAVTVLELTGRAIEHGTKLCHEWMDRFLACEQANHWPGYAEQLVPFDVLDGVMDQLVFDEDSNEESEQ